MDNAEALEAFEAIMAEAMTTVKQHGGKHGVYLNDLAGKVRNHLTDPGYVRVPVEPTAEMLIDGAKAARDWLSQPGPYPRSKAVYRAMLTAATGESHD